MASGSEKQTKKIKVEGSGSESALLALNAIEQSDGISGWSPPVLNAMKEFEKVTGVTHFGVFELHSSVSVQTLEQGIQRQRETLKDVYMPDVVNEISPRPLGKPKAISLVLMTALESLSVGRDLFCLSLYPDLDYPKLRKMEVRHVGWVDGLFEGWGRTLVPYRTVVELRVVLGDSAGEKHPLATLAILYPNVKVLILRNPKDADIRAAATNFRRVKELDLEMEPKEGEEGDDGKEFTLTEVRELLPYLPKYFKRLDKLKVWGREMSREDAI